MTLSFKTKIDGKDTYFPNKIMAGLIENKLIRRSDYWVYLMQFQEKLGFTMLPARPKIHTIREDLKDRWKAGNKIHFVINNRTPDCFQFAPVILVTSIQRIRIFPLTEDILITNSFESKGGKILSEGEIETLSKNDGFDSVDDFWKYFNTPTSGKLIHWTNHKY